MSHYTVCYPLQETQCPACSCCFSLGQPLPPAPETYRQAPPFQIARIFNRTVLYFDAHGKPADSTAKGGFYRTVEIHDTNRILIQDFNSTGNALVKPYWSDCRKLSVFPDKHLTMSHP